MDCNRPAKQNSRVIPSLFHPPRSPTAAPGGCAASLRPRSEAIKFLPVESFTFPCLPMVEIKSIHHWILNYFPFPVAGIPPESETHLSLTISYRDRHLRGCRALPRLPAPASAPVINTYRIVSIKVIGGRGGRVSGHLSGKSGVLYELLRPILRAEQQLNRDLHIHFRCSSASRILARCPVVQTVGYHSVGQGYSRENWVSAGETFGGGISLDNFSPCPVIPSLMERLQIFRGGGGFAISRNQPQFSQPQRVLPSNVRPAKESFRAR